MRAVLHRAMEGWAQAGYEHIGFPCCAMGRTKCGSCAIISGYFLVGVAVAPVEWLWLPRFQVHPTKRDHHARRRASCQSVLPI
jgi:hypothetical protein